MSAPADLTLPDRRGLYFLNPTPPPVLSQHQLDTFDTITEETP